MNRAAGGSDNPSENKCSNLNITKLVLRQQVMKWRAEVTKTSVRCINTVGMDGWIKSGNALATLQKVEESRRVHHYCESAHTGCEALGDQSSRCWVRAKVLMIRVSLVHSAAFWLNCITLSWSKEKSWGCVAQMDCANIERLSGQIGAWLTCFCFLGYTGNILQLFVCLICVPFGWSWK